MRTAAEYVAGLDVLPLARVVNDARVDDHHAIIPTGEIPTKKLEGDDARVFDLVVRRFLAVFHPEAKFEDTEIITAAADHRFRTRGKRLVEAGWRGAAFGEEAAAEEPPGDEDEPRQVLPKVDEGEQGTCEKAEVLEKQTKPPPRYSEASLLRDMETAGKQIEDEELRLAMKDAGLGTPATRAETIEKLLRVGYIERLGRALRATAKGRQAIGILHDHALTSAELTGNWEKRLTAIERGQEQRDRFMEDIRRFTTEVVEYFRNLTAEEVRAQRAEIGPCPNGDGIIRENRAAYGCSSWQSKEEPGCGFVIWKQQKGRGISPGEARDLLEHGQTELLDGFKTRPSRARLVLAEGNKVQLIAEDGTRLDAPAGPRETIATCPKCGQEIRENSRAYGCSSWKSRKEPGCGFVIWKSTKGRQISVEEARQVIESGVSEWMDFKDRKGPFRGRLVLQPDHTVAVQREDEPAATAHRLPEPPLSSSAMPIRAIVTGGAGFIGSHLDRRAARARRPGRGGRRPLDGQARAGARRRRVPPDRHPLGRPSCATLATEFSPDAVFHLAAQADVRVSVDDPGHDADVNVRGTAEVLEAARVAGARLVFSSTGGAIYGEVDTIPSPESTPCAAMAPYGVVQALRRALRRALQPPLRHEPRRPALRQRVRAAPGSARRGRRRRDLLRQAHRGRDPGRLRRRQPDARLRVRRRRRRREPGRARLPRGRTRSSTSAPRPRRACSTCWPSASARRAPTSRPSTGRRAWASSPAARSTGRWPSASWAGGRQTPLRPGPRRDPPVDRRQ